MYRAKKSVAELHRDNIEINNKRGPNLYNSSPVTTAASLILFKACFNEILI